MRDDFVLETKRVLSDRVGGACSNPDCRALTSGPQDNSSKALNIGVAAHITAASPGGPRHDASLSPADRCHADNGIWLCQNCAKLIDNDPGQFTAAILRAWKTIAEHRARYSIGKTASKAPPAQVSTTASASEPLSRQAQSIQLSSVDVEFTPWQGQSEKMYLMVTNRGVAQMFRGQCRVLARRNDPNPQLTLMFDLTWQGSDHLSKPLSRGQQANLLIASAGDDSSRNMEWLRLEAAFGQHAPDSRWIRGERRLPEYDVEITILGDKADQPQSKLFTVRAGKNCALEMYYPSIHIEVPANDQILHTREMKVKGSVGIPRARVQLFVFAAQRWHSNGDARVTGNTWEGTCWLGDQNAIRGEYRIIAVADGGIDPEPKYKWLPESGYRSNEVKINLERVSSI